MRVDLFDFTLPESAIACEPLAARDASKLLYLPASGDLQDKMVRDIPSLLQPGDVMVFNDSRVIPARLYGMRDDIPIELLLHQSINAQEWYCFAKPAKRLKAGHSIIFANDFSASVLGRTPDGQVHIRFDCDDVFAMLERYGEMPLPPYMQRRAGLDDKTTYQTVYANAPGSVAAPTAGLHFTPELLAAIDAAGATRAHVTLHVGAGTFLPVKSDDTDDHVMHTEWAQIDEKTASIINNAKRVIAVGTTSARTLESLSDAQGTMHAGTTQTQIFIKPGYQFKSLDVLMTNFHLPRSTLLMLVSALVGRERILKAYDHAIKTGYRFYSYGDACWLENTQN